MPNPPVHWHDGMVLHPQHFQAADRHAAEQTRLAAVAPGVGIHTLDIDEAALAIGRFSVVKLVARLADGTLIRVPDDVQLPPLDLPRADRLTVSIDVPADRFRLDTPPTGIADDTRGFPLRPVTFRRLNAELRTDESGLPLATVDRTGEGWKLDRRALPPLIACAAWPSLLVDGFAPLAENAERLAARVGRAFAAFPLGPDDPDAALTFNRLRLLTEVAAVARFLADTPSVSPTVAALELTRLVGRLAAFGPPPYTVPTDLFPLLDRLAALLPATAAVIARRPFRGRGVQLLADLDAEWTADGWDLYVGVESNLSAAQVRTLLGHAQLKLRVLAPGATDDLPPTFDPPPRQLADRDTVFRLPRSAAGWPAVVKAGVVGIQLNPALVQGPLDGKDQLQLRNQPGGTAPTLRFTLYAVPPTV